MTAESQSSAGPSPMVATASEPEPKLRQFPGYETLGVLGVGGMGVVYRARQSALQRLVAIKTLRNHEDATPRELAKFRFEAEIVAQLAHANIVQLYHIGEVQGQPFLAFELVEGGSLAKRIAGRPQPPREAAELVQTLARAAHAAHLRGVVHRDLTPNNILLTADGTPKIADFGLARTQERSAHSMEQIAGTASYMAPEQVWGDVPGGSFGPTTDVYGLGAILYELLTGRPPFKGSTSRQTLQMVYHNPPLPPRQIEPSVPPDLETICLRCLEKDPDRRFASADALADDLRRYLHNEPIASRHVSRRERAWLWCRRNPLIAGLAAGLLVAVAFGLGGTSYKAVEASRAATSFQQESRTSKRLATEATAGRKAAETAQKNEEAANRQLRSQLYEFLILATERQLGGSGPLGPTHRATALDYLRQCPPELRNFEWHRLLRRIEGSDLTRVVADHELSAAAVSPDGSRVAVVGRYTNKEFIDPVYLWNTQTWQVAEEVGDGGHVLAFSPDSRRLAIKWDETVRLWDVAAARKLVDISASSDLLAFRPDGKVLAVGFCGFRMGRDENGKFKSVREPCEIRLFEADEFHPLEVKRPNMPPLKLGIPHAKLQTWLEVGAPLPRAAAFTKDGQRLVAALGWSTLFSDEPAQDGDSRLQVWDLESKKKLADVPAPAGEIWHGLALRPDDRQCAVLAGNGVRLFDLPAGKEVGRLVAIWEASAVAYSPDGRSLLVGDKSGAILHYDAGTLKPKHLLGGHRGAVLHIGFLADGRLVSVAADGVLKAWSLNRMDPLPGAKPLTISSDSRLLAAGSLDRKAIRVWSLPEQADVAELKLPAAAEGGQSPTPIALAFSADARELWSVTADRTVRLWNLAEQKLVKSIPLGPPLEVDLGALRFAPATKGEAKTETPPTLSESKFIQHTAEFSPDRRYLLLAATWREKIAKFTPFSPDWQNVVTIELWDLRESRRLVAWTDHGLLSATIKMAFDPSGTAVYAAEKHSFGKPTIHAWEVATGRPLAGTLTFPAPLDSAISPDGARELKDDLGTMKLYDKRSGRELVTVWSESLSFAQFAPSGQFIFGVQISDGIPIIDATPQQEFPPPPTRRQRVQP